MRICIAGVDGSGKTLLARGLCYKLVLRRSRCWIHWVKGIHGPAYLLKSLYLLSPMLSHEYIINPTGVKIRRFRYRFLRKMKPLYMLLEFLGLLYITFFIKLAEIAYGTVILERSFLDTIVFLSHILNEHNWFAKGFLGRFLNRMLHTCNCRLYVYASPERVLKRRPNIEYTSDELGHIYALYNVLARIYRFNIIINNTDNYTDMARYLRKITEICYDGMYLSRSAGYEGD